MKVPYSNQFADWYDTFYSDKPYAQEAQFIHNCFLRNGRWISQVLELACGTANHAFELENMGYHVTATDISSDMLRYAQGKKEARGSTVDLCHMDMRTINFPASSFDAVTCLFDSIGYVQTNQAVLDVMSGVFRVLRSGGIFLFEFWHSAAMLKYYEPVRARSWETVQGTVERISETDIDYVKNLVSVKYTIFGIQPNGMYECYRETHTNCFFSIPEMENYLHQVGFLTLAWYAGFEENKPVRADTWHILVMAQKPEERGHQAKVVLPSLFIKNKGRKCALVYLLQSIK